MAYLSLTRERDSDTGLEFYQAAGTVASGDTSPSIIMLGTETPGSVVERRVGFIQVNPLAGCTGVVQVTGAKLSAVRGDTLDDDDWVDAFVGVTTPLAFDSESPYTAIRFKAAGGAMRYKVSF